MFYSHCWEFLLYGTFIISLQAFQAIILFQRYRWQHAVGVMMLECKWIVTQERWQPLEIHYPPTASPPEQWRRWGHRWEAQSVERGRLRTWFRLEYTFWGEDWCRGAPQRYRMSREFLSLTPAPKLLQLRPCWPELFSLTLFINILSVTSTVPDSLSI